MNINNKKRRYTPPVVVLLIILLSANLSSAKFSPENQGKINSEILEELNGTSEVRVIVDIHSKNDIIIDNILSDLSTSEFKIIGKLIDSSGFYGNITEQGLSKLINDPHVKNIRLDKIVYTTLQQSLPLINATKVWANGYTGKGQTICVIDTGINYSHSDLGGCIGSSCKVLSGYDFVNNDNNPEAECGETSCSDGVDNDWDSRTDEGGHGTNVAGIVAAKGAINGTAPDAKLIAMKVCDWKIL